MHREESSLCSLFVAYSIVLKGLIWKEITMHLKIRCSQRLFQTTTGKAEKWKDKSHLPNE